jgi:hypothetical protein
MDLERLRLDYFEMALPAMMWYAHPNHIEKFIGPETEVVGTYEMDPLGMGPVTMTFTFGRKQTSYDEFYNADLHRRINAAKKKNGSHAKVIAGASGTWQYNYAPEKIEEYGLYAILEGELGGIAPEIDGNAGRFFNYLILFVIGHLTLMV